MSFQQNKTVENIYIAGLGSANVIPWAALARV